MANFDNNGELILSANVAQSVININNQIKDIEKKLSNISVNLNIDNKQISELTKQISQNASSFKQVGNNMGEQLVSGITSDFKKSFSNSSDILNTVKKSFSGLGNINVSWTKDVNEDFKSITATVKNAEGIIEKFKYTLNSKTDTFNLTGITGADSGVPKVTQVISEYEKKFAQFQSSNSRIWSGLTEEINKFQSELGNLKNNTGNIDKVSEAFNSLKVSASNITSNLSNTSASLNKVDQAVNNLNKMPNTIESLKSSFNGLSNQPQEVANQLNGLSSQLEKVKQIQSQMGTNEQWSAEYKKLAESVQEVTNKVNLLKTTEKDAQSTEALEKSKTRLLANLDAYTSSNSKFMTSNSQDAKDLRDRYQELYKQIKMCSDASDFQSLNKDVSTLKSNVKEAGLATKNFKDILKEDIYKFGEFYLAGGMMVGVVGQIKQSVEELKNLDSVLTEISKTSDLTTAELDKLGESAFDTASKYGRTASDYLTSVQEMSRSGFYGQQAEDMANLSLILQSAGDIGEEEADSFLLSSNAAYKLGGDITQLMSIIDGSNNITNHFSTNMADMSVGMSKAGSVASTYGVQVNQLASLIGTASSATKKSGEEIGNAMRSIFINLQNISSNKINSTFDNLGISMTKLVDGSEQLKTPIELLKELQKVYNDTNTSSMDKSSILTNIFGKHQANVGSAILQNWDTYEKMLDSYSEGFGSAQSEADKSAKSWEGSLNALSNSATEFFNVFVNRHEVADFIQLLTGGVNVVTDFVSELGVLPTIMASISAVTSVKSTGLFDFKQMKQLTDAYKSTSTDINELTELTKGLNLTQAQSVLATKNLTNAQKEEILVARGFSKEEIDKSTALKNSTQATQQASSGMTSFSNGVNTKMLSASTSVKAFGMAMATTMKATMVAMLSNPFTWITIGISLFSKFKEVVDKANPSLKDLQETLDNQAQSYKNAQSEVESLESQLESLKNKMIEVENINGVTVSKDGELEKLQAQTDELEAQLVIAKEKAKLEGQKTEKTAIKTVNKTIDSKYATHDEVTMGTMANGYNTIKQVADEVTRYEELNLAMEEYNKLSVERSNIADKNSKEYSDLSNKMNETKNYATELASGLADDSQEIYGFTDEGEKLKKQLDSTNVAYSDWIQGINQASIANSELTTSQQGLNEAISEGTDDTETDTEDKFAYVDEAMSAVDKLNQAKEKLEKGNLSESDVFDLLKDFPELAPYIDITAENFGDLAKGLDEVSKVQLDTIVSQLELMLAQDPNNEALKQMIELIKQLADTVETSDFNIKFGIDTTSATTITNDVESILNTVKSAQEEINSYSSLSSKSLSSLYDSFKDDSDALSSLDKFQAGLISLTELSNVLESKSTEVKDAWSEAMKENQESSESFYDNIIMQDSELVNRLYDNYQINKNDFDTIQELKEGIFDIFSDNVKDINNDMISELADKYGTDLENFLKAQQEKINALKDLLKALDTVSGVADYIHDKADPNNFSPDMMDDMIISGNKEMLEKLKKENPKAYEELVNGIKKDTKDTISDLEKSKTETQKAIDELNNIDLTSSKYTPIYTGSNSDKSGSGSGKDKSKSEKEQIDYLSQSLDVLKEKVDDAETSLSSLQTNGSKNYFEDQAKAIKKVNTELSGLKTGYTKAKNKYSDLYTDELDKLSSKQRKSIKSKIESGKEFSLKSYDKDTAEIIKSAMGYYNNIQDMNNNIADTTQKIKDNEKQLIQNSLDQLSFEIENIDGKLDNEGLGYKKQNKLLDDKKKLLKEQYTLNKKLATSDEERAKLLLEYKNNLKELNSLKGQNYRDLQQSSVDLQQQSIDYLQNEIDKRKELGDTITGADYDAIILKQNSMKQSYENMYESMRKELNSLVKSGSIEEFSQEWYEWETNLGEIKLKIQDINTQLEDTADAIKNIKWDNFANGIDKVKNAQDEISDVLDMLSDYKVDDNGAYTEDGLTAIALYGKQISTNQALVNKYKEALAELNKDYKNGAISEAEYTSKTVEFSDAMRESAKAVQSANQAIVDLKIEQLEAEKTAYDEVTEKQKEYLQKEREAYELAKKQQDSNQSLARLKSKYEQLRLNTDETDRSNYALMQQLKAEIAEREKQQEEDLYYDRNDAEQDALDEANENFDKAQDEKIKLLQTSTDEQNRVIKESLSETEQQYNTVLGNINGIASEYGITLTDTITSPWVSAQNELQKYMDMVGQLKDVNIGTSGTSNSLNEISSQIYSILGSASGTGKGTSTLNQAMQSNGYNQLSYKQMAELANLFAISGSTNYSAKDMKSDTNLKNLLLEALVTSGYLKDNLSGLTGTSGTGTFSKTISVGSGNLSSISTGSGITKSDRILSENEIKKKLKGLTGFSNGGIIKGLGERIRLNGDDVLVSAKVGEGFLRENEVSQIGKLADVIPQIDSIVSSLPKVTSVDRVGNGITIDKFVGVEVQGDGIVSEKILAEANKNTYDMLKNQGAKIISQSMKRS